MAPAPALTLAKSPAPAVPVPAPHYGRSPISFRVVLRDLSCGFMVSRYRGIVPFGIVMWSIWVPCRLAYGHLVTPRIIWHCKGIHLPTRGRYGVGIVLASRGALAIQRKRFLQKKQRSCFSAPYSPDECISYWIWVTSHYWAALERGSGGTNCLATCFQHSS